MTALTSYPPLKTVIDSPPAPAQLIRTAGKLRLGLLSNPLSGSNRRRLHTLDKRLGEHPWVWHYQVRTPAEVAAALRELAGREAQVIAVNGGDGTVAAALTALLQQPPSAGLPLLAVIPGGTTNMTAGDVGLPGPQDRALGRLLAWAADPNRPARIVQRPVLRVQAAPGREPVFGMFFGAGIVIKGIEFFHHRIVTLGLRRSWATGLALGRMVAALLRRDPAYTAPVAIAVGLNGGEARQSRYLVVLVSTLERLFFGLRPFWGYESGALRYTAVRDPPRHALRAMPPLCRGRPNRLGTEENGYFSHNIDELSLLMDSPFTLDGELYQTDTGSGPLTIRPSGPVSFVRL